jgi:16S rRNA (guanine966-N2)-methyltransferase
MKPSFFSGFSFFPNIGLRFFQREVTAMAGRKQKTRPHAGRLRIVAGNWRSRLLDIADVEGLRPTSERIRETLFNWLAPEIAGARCLDLFAGTGALGLEALSRGARSVVFVERSAIAARQLEKNIGILVGTGPPTGADVVRGDALEYLWRDTDDAFDIVFLDPPFADDRLNETCRLLAQRNLLADGALVYLEMERSQQEPELPDGWQAEKNKTAGNVRYMLVRTGEARK